MGVIRNDHLKFHAYTASAIHKVNKVIVTRKKFYKNLDMLIVTHPLQYKSMARPNQECDNLNMIWAHHYLDH